MKKIIALITTFSVLIVVLLHSCKKVSNDIAINKPPVANAGADQVLILPKDSVMLNGTNSYDPEKAIMIYQWTKIVGPESYVIRNANSLRIAGTVTVFQAPVNQFYAAQLQQFNLPSNVSAVDYDDKGNSIWFRIATEGLPSFHFDATKIGMEGTVLIVGGTGKFAGATGETTFHAEFDQASWDNNSKMFTSCSMWQKGWIRY